MAPEALANVGASEPFGHDGAVAAAVCRCGRGQHSSRSGLCAGGHPLVGSPGPALVVGQHAATFWIEQAEARQAVEAAILRDAGHTPDDAPEALRLAAASIAQAALVQSSAFARLVEGGGPLTARGRTRRAFTVWQAATDRLERGLRLVGLTRRARPIDPLEAVRLAVEAANRT